MKVAPTLFTLLSLNSVAFSAPTANPNPATDELVAANQSPYFNGIAHANLDKRVSRLQCKAVAHAIWAVTSWEVANIFTTNTLDTIKGICERHDNKQCAMWVADVKDGFDLIFRLGFVFKQGTVAVDAYNSVMNNGRRSIAQKNEDDEFRSNLEDVLRKDGYGFDSLERDSSSAGVKKARDTGNGNKTEPALLSRYILRNWRPTDEKNGQKNQDTPGRTFALHRYNDGSGQLHLHAADDSTSSRTKRHDGAGVKISFQHEKTSFQPTRADRSSATSALASKWQELAESGVGEMFGFAAHYGTAMVYYRTIVEGKGFGGNYESVDDCGSLASHVGTYLGNP